MRKRAGVALLVSAVVACTPDALPSDAGTDVPIELDAGVPDAGVDAPPATPFCRPCRRDSECGDGALCLFLDGGERACGVPCGSDADCAGLPLGARCEEESPGLPLSCRPAGLDCSPSPPGEACGAGCAGTYDRCVDPEGLGAYCTTACASSADCPEGLRRCATVGADRVCVRDEASPPERCAAIADAGLAMRCAADGSCPSGRTCHGTGPIRLCLAAPSGGSCPAGHVAMTAASGSVCVPHVAVAGAPLAELAPDCSCVLEDDGLFLEAAAAAGRSRCELRFPTSLLDAFGSNLAHDRFRLSMTDRLHLDWLAAPAFGQAIGDRLDDARDTPSPSAALFREAAILADLELPDPPAAPAVTELVAALVGLATRAGGTVDEGSVSVELAALDPALAAALASVVAATEAALAAREEAVAGYVDVERRRLFGFASGLFLAGVPDASAPDAWRVGALLGDVDVGAMARATADLLAALDRVAALPAPTGLPISIEIPTAVGRIAIRGTSDSMHAAVEGPGLLVVDLGGNDTYRSSAGATASETNGVSVLLDLGGTDDYAYDEVPDPNDVGPPGHRRLASDSDPRFAPTSSSGPATRSRFSRQGAGRLGIGVLYDVGPEGDHYRSLRMSQGYGALGVGVLVDTGGNDVYEGEAAVQGAAVAGVGLLVDLGGDDEHVAYHASQGFAYTRGVGVLFDDVGTDIYFAHPSDVLYWSPQSPGASNSSFCQGAGFGRRDDGGGLYMSGGVGIVRDRAGDDRYTVGIFGQATGYWYGAGFLLDEAGADHYDGEWYVQAGDAHFAIAALLDDGGDDVFNEVATRRNASVAGGHDFSVAWLLDRAGTDTFHAPGLALGVGHAGGFGAFVDLDGADTYDTYSDFTLGHASIETPGDVARRMSGTVGVFVDRGGTDFYTRPTTAPVANEASWTQALHGTPEEEHGAGVDRAIGEVGVGLD